MVCIAKVAEIAKLSELYRPHRPGQDELDFRKPIRENNLLRSFQLFSNFFANHANVRELKNSALHRSTTVANFAARIVLAGLGRQRKMLIKQIVQFPVRGILLLLVCLFAGCGTTIQRNGMEQILLSDAVDMAVAQLDFGQMYGQTVYLDTSYLQSVKGESFVNAPYITSALRQQLTAAGCLLQDNRDDAKIIVEPRVGALGANGHEITYGIPRNNLLNAASTLVPNAPPVPAIPELSIARVDAYSGVAKVLVFAYDRETRDPIWQSGVARAEATSRNSWILGAGPFQKGTVHNGTRFAGTGLKKRQFAYHDPAPGILYSQPFVFAPVSRDERTAHSIGDVPPDESEDNVTR